MNDLLLYDTCYLSIGVNMSGMPSKFKSDPFIFFKKYLRLYSTCKERVVDKIPPIMKNNGVPVCHFDYSLCLKAKIC